MPRPPRPLPDKTPPATGVLIRADNGDVVTFDETGLTLRLSDAVIADLRDRLALAGAVPRHIEARLGDIDAWALRQEGEWLRFTARLERDRPPRDYMMPATGGDMVAAAPGPLYALFSLGGARRAGFNDGPPEFPYHILAPGDDIGSVGLEGTDEAQLVDGLQRLPHSSRDALIAEALLHWRYQAMRGLPLFVVRGETDHAGALPALGKGVAYRNLLTALDNLVAAAARLGKPAKVVAVGLDYGLEDQVSDPAAFAAGLRALMAQIERDMAARRLHRPIFALTAEAGTHRITRHPAMLAHWELAWSPGGHDLVVAAAGYMFEQTEFGRPTAAARLRMAEMDAHAIAARSQRQPWFCPLPLLAEAQGNRITVICRAMSDLVLDPALNAGASCGFAVEDAAGEVEITGVAIAPDDPRSLVLTCSHPPSVGALLHYAHAAPGPSPDAFPANRGAVRDGWAAPSRGGGGPLHRWALPACLPIHAGGS